MCPVWEQLEPLLPVRPRAVCYVRDNPGIGWNRLPTALFGASGATCWRRLTEWHVAGVRQQLHERLLAELRAAGLLDLSAALVDSTHLRPLKRGHTGPSPVDRRKLGSKHHLITDAHGTPLAVTLTGGQRNDVTQLIPLLDAIPPIRGAATPALRRPRLRGLDPGCWTGVPR